MARKDQAQNIITCEDCANVVEFYCNPCKTKICENCLIKHMRISSENGHEIIEYKSRKVMSYHCDLHAKSTCDVYCRTCCMPVCSSCIASNNHKQHDMTSLSEVVDFFVELVLEENKELNLNTKLAYQKQLFYILRKLPEIPNHYKSAREEVSKNGVRWHKEIDECVSQFHTFLNQAEKTHIETLEKQKAFLEEVIDNIDQTMTENQEISTCENLKLLLNFRSTLDRFIKVPSLEDFDPPVFKSYDIDKNQLNRVFGKLETLLQLQKTLTLKDNIPNGMEVYRRVSERRQKRFEPKPSKDDNEGRFSKKGSIFVKLDPQIIKFLVKSKRSVEFEKLLDSLNAKPLWFTIQNLEIPSTSLEIQYVLPCNAFDTGSNTSAQKLEEKLSKCVYDYIDNLTVKRVLVPGHKWEQLMAAMRSVVIDRPDDVAVIARRKSSTIELVGITEVVNELHSLFTWHIGKMW